MVKYIEKEYKSILNVLKFIDSWYWCRYTLNTYNGCQFGCIYCDSRSEKYHMPTDFENIIIVKKNVKELLDKRLTRARKLLPDVVAISGANDPYQPAETRYRNTRQCLEVLAKHKYPVGIGTKSQLVLRDLDLLEKIGKNNWSSVSVTITTTDSEVAKFLEPRAPPPQERFDIIRTIKEQTTHIQAGVSFIPIVPYLCDSDENLEAMVQNIKDSGADFILFGSGITMRDLQARWFLKHLKERYPELIEKYEELYEFKYNPTAYEGKYTPKARFFKKNSKKMLDLCVKYDLPYRVKRFIPNDFRRMNYIISEKLLNEAYRLQMLGKAWSNKHWAGLNIQNLKESIVNIAKRNELQKIRNVTNEIEAFIRENFDDDAEEGATGLLRFL
ncbi:MAG: radical SAM protein [Promethearchaeota archaeon]